jgi:hypothetical protein
MRDVAAAKPLILLMILILILIFPDSDARPQDQEIGNIDFQSVRLADILSAITRVAE